MVVQHKGIFTVIDREDREKVTGYLWGLTGEGYVTAFKQKQKIKLHRLIMNAVNNEDIIDHIDGNLLNNTKANLRFATNSENTRNSKVHKNNRSGYKGVGFDNQRWRARIQIDGKAISLGFFDTREAAARACDSAARKYFGEFACVNFPLLGERGCR
mgnify:CR=1 FL=1